MTLEGKNKTDTKIGSQPPPLPTQCPPQKEAIVVPLRKGRVGGTRPCQAWTILFCAGYPALTEPV
uniref:Uncharacterized protein n=1 Tax=Picea glauca TaxID=3330 RepID=A0A124GMK1_PICGL|nr:hypothetical protein ABT39_MTgene2261 [Picea glauca]QHR88138.1 hypothetical protein Q903MT_gene2151 [Picea sitchensis]